MGKLEYTTKVNAILGNSKCVLQDSYFQAITLSYHVYLRMNWSCHLASFCEVVLSACVRYHY